jgi:two-component system, LytTR family, sensor kinase
MKPRLARALIVLTVFGLMVVLAATDRYVTELAAPPAPPPRSAPAAPAASAVPSVQRTTDAHFLPLPLVFLNQFRIYLAWALVTPGVLYLSRRVPLLGRHRGLALAFHAVIPLIGSLPFFYLRLFVNMAFGLRLPPLTLLLDVPWSRVVALQAVAAVPVYWLLVGVGTFLRFSREYAANELAEIELRHSLAVAQHDALRMKLQPHFLFNALNAIASLARLGESDAVVRVVDHLGTLLRLSMEASARQLVTLDEELALVDAYLAIESVRFEDRVKVVRRIAPDARHALVPNLILQPLVENALVHGLSRRLDASLLEVAVRRDGRLLRIAVRDDGPGLPASWSLAANAGAGLRNVIDRIQGLFQGDGGFRLENGPTGGAVAILSIPFADAETTAVAAERESWTA